MLHVHPDRVTTVVVSHVLRCHHRLLVRTDRAMTTSAARAVRAHYLRPDADEVPILQALALAGSHPGVLLTWGDQLPAHPHISDQDQLPAPMAEAGTEHANHAKQQVGSSDDHTPMHGEGAGVQVLITRIPTAEELDSLPCLAHLIVPFAGPTEKAKALIKARPTLSLHNTHFNAASTAELAVTLLLAATKQISQRDAGLREEAKQNRMWTPGWESKVSVRSPLIVVCQRPGHARCPSVQSLRSNSTPATQCLRALPRTLATACSWSDTSTCCLHVAPARPARKTPWICTP